MSAQGELHPFQGDSYVLKLLSKNEYDSALIETMNRVGENSKDHDVSKKVAYLLRKGANANVQFYSPKNKFCSHNNALSIAAHSCFPETVQTLLQYNADPRISPKILTLTIASDSAVCKCYCSIDKKFCFVQDQCKTLSLLIKAHANKDILNYRNKSLLHLCASSNFSISHKINVMTSLLENGCPVLIRDSENQTALDILRTRSFTHIYNTLENDVDEGYQTQEDDIYDSDEDDVEFKDLTIITFVNHELVLLNAFSRAMRLKQHQELETILTQQSAKTNSRFYNISQDILHIIISECYNHKNSYLI